MTEKDQDLARVVELTDSPLPVTTAGANEVIPPENDDDIPVLIRQELMRCAVGNGRINYWYLCNVWRLGHDSGYTVGWVHGLDESGGDPRVERIEAGFKAMHAATNGEYSREDMVVMDALQSGRDYAVRLMRREEHISQLIAEIKDADEWRRGWIDEHRAVEELSGQLADMRAALKDLLGVIATDDLIPEEVSYMRKARAAIAKAEGR